MDPEFFELYSIHDAAAKFNCDKIQLKNFVNNYLRKGNMVFVINGPQQTKLYVNNWMMEQFFTHYPQKVTKVANSTTMSVDGTSIQVVVTKDEPENPYDPEWWT